jgi:hypothetical protein
MLDLRMSPLPEPMNEFNAEILALSRLAGSYFRHSTPRRNRELKYFYHLPFGTWTALKMPNMLRITATDSTLTLHGQLAGPFVAELESVWNKSLSVVDLSEVTFVDEAGARVLCAMKEAGVRFVARGVDTKHLLDGLKCKEAPPLRRCLSWLSKDACRKDGGK